MSVPVVINEAWCKGCEICVDFCPTRVLEMDGLKAIVARPDDCIGCMLCEIHCPDLAIKVFKEYVKRKKEASTAVAGND